MMRHPLIPCGVVLAVLLGGCVSGPGSVEEVVVVGSDTMLDLDRRLAEGFMRENPGTRIVVKGGGSGVGIEALIDGAAAIAAASRPLSAAEVAALHEVHQTLGIRHLVAQDALSVFVNAENAVRDLSMDQLRGLFSGRFEDWAEVGGDPAEVQVIVRPPSSGTHRFFRDHVLGGQVYDPLAVTAPTTRAVLSTVAEIRGAVGYGGVAYRLEGAVPVAVDGVEPTAENVGRGLYPLTRYLVFYTVRPPTGLAHRFLEWCLGDEGQRVVADVGYVPLWARDG